MTSVTVFGFILLYQGGAREEEKDGEVAGGAQEAAQQWKVPPQVNWQ